MVTSWQHLLLSIILSALYISLFVFENEYILKYRARALYLTVVVTLIVSVYLLGIDVLFISVLEFIISLALFFMFIFLFHLSLVKLIKALIATFFFGLIALLLTYNVISNYFFQWSTILLVVIFVKNLIYESIFEK